MGHSYEAGPDAPAGWPADGYPDRVERDDRSAWSGVPDGLADPRCRQADGSSPGRDRHQSRRAGPPDGAVDGTDSPSVPTASPPTPQRRSWSFLHDLVVVMPAALEPDAIATSQPDRSQRRDRADAVIDRCDGIESATNAPSGLADPQLRALAPGCPLAASLGQRVFERIVAHNTAGQGGVRDDTPTAAPDSLPVVSTIHEPVLSDGDGTGIRPADRLREICGSAMAHAWLVPWLPFGERSSTS